MQFFLSNPRCWSAATIGDGDWMYIAGGSNTGNKAEKHFRKINLTTGDEVDCADLRMDATAAHLIKFS